MTSRSPTAGRRATSGSNSYDDVLPSFNLRYKATDNFFLRFAVAQGHRASGIPAAAAVDHDQRRRWVSSRAASACRCRRTSTLGNCVAGYNGFAGNADLKPMEATNYDLSAEWYINSTNSLTLALFDKEVSGLHRDDAGQRRALHQQRRDPGRHGAAS